MVTRMMNKKTTLRRRKDSCGKSVIDWYVLHGERHGVVGDWQGAMVDGL